MSAQSAKKKRFGSRRRVTNQNKTNEADGFLVTDSTSVSQHSIPEEKSVNALVDTDNSVSQTENPPSPELTSNRRKLGSSRRNKGGRYVEDSTETHHKLREEVEEKTRVSESPGTSEMSLAFQPEEEENLSKGYEHDVSGIQESLSYLSEELPSVYSVKEEKIKYTEESTEVLKQDGTFQSDGLLSESNVESEATLFAPPVEMAEENSSKEHTEMMFNVQQETFSSTTEELSTKEEENEIFNLSDENAQNSDDVSNFFEEVMKTTQMYGIDNNNERLMHESTEMFSDNLLDQVELTLKRSDADSTKQEDLSLDKNDEQNKNKNTFEALDNKTEGYYVYDAEKPPTSVTDRPETEVGQLNDKEGSLDYHIKPSDQQTFNKNFVTKDEHNDTDLSPTGSPSQVGSSHENKLGRQVEDSDGESCCKPTQEVEKNTFVHKELETKVLLPIEIATQEKSADESSPIEHSEDEWSVKKATCPSPKEELSTNPDVTKAMHPKEENKSDAFDGKNEYYKEGPQIGEKEKVDTALGQLYEMEGRVEDDMKLMSEQTGHFEKDGLFIELEESKSILTLQSNMQVSLSSQPLHNSPTAAETYHRSTEEDMEMTMDYESLETTIVETDVEGNLIETTLTEIDMFDEAQTEVLSCQVKYVADGSTLIDESGPTSLNLHLSSTDQKLAVESLKMPDKELHSLYCLAEEEKADKETEQFRPYVNLQESYLVNESFLKSEEKDLSFVRETTTDNHSPPGDTEPQCSIKREEFSSQKIDVAQTQMQEINYSSERVTDDDTDNSAILSGKPMDQVSDTYQLELTVESTEFANMQNYPDADDNVLHRAEEGILPDVQDMIAPLDNPPQDYSNSSKEQTQTDYSLNTKRKKMGSSRRYKDRQQHKDTVAESNHEHKEEVNEEQKASQIVLVTERASQEELLQGSYYDNAISETHDDPMFSGILNFGAQSSTISIYPETNLESLFLGSESLQADHSERERHFLVEESKKSMLVNLEGMDKSVFLRNEEVKGTHHSNDDLKEVHEDNVQPTQMQDIQEIESVLHDSNKNVGMISENLTKESESELTVKSTDNSQNKQEDLHPYVKLEDGGVVEALDQAKKDDNVNDSKKPEEITNKFREDVSPVQADKAEGHVEDEFELGFEQTGYHEKEDLFFGDEDSESSLQTLTAEMQAPNSQEQQIDWKVDKDSSAESYNRHTEEVVQETGEKKQVETIRIPLTVEIAKEENMDTVLEEMQPNDTVQTKEVCDQVKNNDHVCTILDEHNSLSLHSSLTVDNQPASQSNVMEMPGEKLTQVCSVSEKENGDKNVENDFYRQDGKLQVNYEMSQSAFTQEIPTEKDLPGQNPDDRSVEQDVSTELSANEEEKEHVTMSQANVRPHSGDTVYEIHEEEIKPTQTQEVQHIYYTVEESDSSFHAPQSETNIPSDSELQQINPTIEKTVTETFHEPKEEFVEKRSSDEDLYIKATSISSEGYADIKLEPIIEVGNDKDNTFTVLSQNLKDNRAIVKTAVTTSLCRHDFEEEKKVIGDPKNVSQRTEFNETDLTLSPKESGLKDGLDRENTPCHDDIVFTGSSDPLEQEDDYHIQKEEALSYDKEEKNDMQKTNDAVETVGRVTIDDYNTEASTADGPVSEKDEVDRNVEDLIMTDQQAQDNMASQDITESEFFAERKTDSLVPLDTGLVANSKAVDVAEEIQSGHLRSEKRKRKFGSNRRTLLKVNPKDGQENKDETKRVEFNTEAVVIDFEEKEVMEEFPALVTAEVSMNEEAKPSLNLVSIPKNETNETGILDFGQMLPSSSSVPKSLESSIIPDNNMEMPLNPEYKGTTGGSFVSLDETTQGLQNDEGRPESADALQHQVLKSTEKQVVAVEDLEIIKAVVTEGDEEQNNVKPSIQDSSSVEEGAQKTHLEMKNASPNLNSAQPRRKMGSTRKNLRSKTKEEELPQKQELDDNAIETTINAEDVKTNFVSGIKEEELKLPVEQEENVSVQKKDRVLETVEYSHTGESHLTPTTYQTSEENPVYSNESDHQQTASYHPAMPSTTSKEDAMSESAAGGRKRKMGSNRKSRGQNNNREATAGEDHIINSENGSDGGSVTHESTAMTAEEESLGLPEASGIEKNNEKASPNIRTSKAGEDTKPESEKKPEQQTPVQHPPADIRFGQEGRKTFSLAGDSSVKGSKSYNVVMVGDSCVGKTSYMKRAQSGKFSLDIPASVGLDSCLWTVMVDGQPVVLQLWDTAGQERFHSITRQIFHKAHAFLLMYDITSSSSFSAVSYWASCIQDGAPENVTVLLLGNKSDHAERLIKTQEGEILAKEYNFEFMECSAATGENVIESLETMARMLSQKVDTREEATVLFKEPQKKKSSGCC